MPGLKVSYNVALLKWPEKAFPAKGGFPLREVSRKELLTYPYHGILFYIKKEWNNFACYNIDDPQKIWNERSQIENTAFCTIALCKNSRERKPIERKHKVDLYLP